MQRVLFIINPKSGTKRNKQIHVYAARYLHADDFSVSFQETKYAGHATEIAKKACDSFDIIVAVGGDGTIHEISQALINSNTSLGIIPMGSGNGFARFMGVPLKQKKAIKYLAQAKTTRVDAIKCNNEFFINVAGVNFDAAIGHAFNTSTKRGIFSYILLVIQLLTTYKPLEITYSCNGKTHKTNAFLASIANSSQWGMNAHIAPHAKINDGQFEFVILKPFPLMASMSIATRIFQKTIHKSKYTETIPLEKLRFETEDTLIMHLDGEPRKIKGPVEFQIYKNALQVMC